MKLNKYVATLVLTLSLTISYTIAAFASAPLQNNSKRYIIKFKTSTSNKNQVIQKYSGNLKHEFKHFNVATAEMTTQSIENLKKDSNVDYVEEDNLVKASATSSTSLTNWGINDINAMNSWQSGLTGNGIKIAVVDTGAGPHSDLKIAGGANVIAGSGTTSYSDDNGHGTHVAGIIVGQGVSGGVKGVAPDSSLYAVKALDSTGSGYTSDIISGIDWAMENNMDIVSLSLGSNQSSMALQNAVDSAYSKGLLVVAAAGNDGNSSATGTSIEYPANYSSVIAVGAVDSTNVRAYFSSTGSKLEVSAPGVNILSTYLNGGYQQMSGTSMATPFVAGDLALLKQKYPSYSNIQLRQLLDNTVKDLGVTGRDSLYGYGLIVAPSNSSQTATPVQAPTAPATPTASILAGNYTSAQTVSLKDSTSSVSIYYTLDGTTPTKASNLYSSPITISSSKTLKAVAIDSTGNFSGVLSVSYVISNTVVTPTVPLTTIPKLIASIPAGSYKTPLIITLIDKYPKPLKGYYTLDGSTPSTTSTPYAGYIKIASTATLKAIAVDYAGNSSEVLSNLYTIIAPPANPVASIRSGIYSKPQSLTLTDTTPGVSIHYTTNGSIPTAKSNLYTGPIVINNNTIIAMIAIDSAGNSSQVVVAKYIIIRK
jgi:minor extracellular protease Epr